MSCLLLLLTLALYLPIYSCIETEVVNQRVIFLILSQPNPQFDERRAFELKADLLKQANDIGMPTAPEVLLSHQNFPDVVGAWAVWPLLKRLVSKLELSESDSYWLFVCESFTRIKLSSLLDLLSHYSTDQSHFLGHSLVDKNPTVIHHYAMNEHGKPAFMYPDFSAGVALTGAVLQTLVRFVSKNGKTSDFAIDAKHELAKLLEVDGIRLENIDGFCLGDSGPHCITEYSASIAECPGTVTDEDVLFGVKTYSSYHKSRVLVVKRTWARRARYIEFYSDRDDIYIPTVTFDAVANTKKGHCQKTMSIIRRFATNPKWSAQQWLVISDDDTLLSVDRMLQLLSCFDGSQAIMVGERYGYGFDSTGVGGYDYATGGSGIIISKAGAKIINNICTCPSNDSPDDMILGMCAKRRNLHLMHWQGMHQARPEDYSPDYLAKITPISFHKHWEVDPYLVYSVWLQDDKTENEDTDTKDKEKDSHTEQHGEL